MTEKTVTFTAEFTFIGQDEFLFIDSDGVDWTEKDFVEWLKDILNVDDVQVKNLRRFVREDANWKGSMPFDRNKIYPVIGGDNNG